MMIWPIIMMCMSSSIKEGFHRYQKAVLSNTDSARDQEILSLDYLILILTKYLKRKSMNESDPLQKTLLIHTYLVMLENAYSKRPYIL